MSARRLWPLVLAGLLFVGIGATVLGGTVAPDIVDLARMRHWVAVPGELLDVRLESHRSRRSTTYEAMARYRYTVGGTAYDGDRVGIAGGADNIGSYQQDWHAHLRKLQRSKAPLTVWVDPDDPASAVLDREPRWGFLLVKALFGLVFAGLGALLVIAGVAKPR